MDYESTPYTSYTPSPSSAPYTPSPAPLLFTVQCPKDAFNTASQPDECRYRRETRRPNVDGQCDVGFSRNTSSFLPVCIEDTPIGFTCDTADPRLCIRPIYTTIKEAYDVSFQNHSFSLRKKK